MGFRQLAASFEHQAPRILGAFFCVAAVLGNLSCNRKTGTPPWNPPETQTNVPPPAETAEAEDEIEIPELSESVTVSSETVSPSGLRFITYNVENWLTMDRYVDRKVLKGAPKPESEKQAVVAILARYTPDAIGLCEIGETSDLAEIQQDLKAAGLDLPHSYYTGGSDPTRRPRPNTNSPAKLSRSTAGFLMRPSRHAGNPTASSEPISNPSATASKATRKPSASTKPVCCAVT
jgi:hypothetical protein